MRAKLPSKDGFVERDGVRIHYEVYGQGGQTMVFLPPWSIVHSRVYKAQLPYFSERFRCIAFDARGNGRSDRPDDVAAYSLAKLRGRCAGGHGRYRCRPGHRGRPLLWRPARLRAGRVPSGTGEGCHPGRYDGGHRAHPQAHVAAAFHGPAGVPRWEASGLEQIQSRALAGRLSDFAEHFIRNIFTEPHSTRQIEKASTGPATPMARVLVKTVEARTIVPPFDVTESMYRRIRCPVLAIHGDNDQIQPHARGKLVAELTGAEFVTIADGGHNPLGRVPAKCNALINDFLDRRLGLAAPKAPVRRAPREKKVLYLSSPSASGTAAATSPSPANCAGCIPACMSTGWRRIP